MRENDVMFPIPLIKDISYCFFFPFRSTAGLELFGKLCVKKSKLVTQIILHKKIY